MPLMLTLEENLSVNGIPRVLALSGIVEATAETQYVDIYWRYDDEPDMEPLYLASCAPGSSISVPFSDLTRQIRLFQIPQTGTGVEMSRNFTEAEQTVFNPVSAEGEGSGDALFSFNEEVHSTTSRATAYQSVIPVTAWENDGDVIRFKFAGVVAFNANNKNFYVRLGTLDDIFTVTDYTGSSQSWRIEGEIMRIEPGIAIANTILFAGGTSMRNQTYIVTPINFEVGQYIKLDISSDDPDDLIVYFGYGERISKASAVPELSEEYLTTEAGDYLTTDSGVYLTAE